MAAGGTEVDYADIDAAAAGFVAVADDLEAGQLASEPVSLAVYGEAAVVVAVARVADALRGRQEVLASRSRFMATTLDAVVAAYRAADARQQEAYEQFFERLKDLGGGAGPQHPHSASEPV